MFERVEAGCPSDAGSDGATRIQNQGGRGLHDVEVVCDVGAVRDINIDVANASARFRCFVQQLVSCRAFGAHLGRELQESHTRAQLFAASELCRNHLAKSANFANASFSIAHDKADDRRNDHQSEQNCANQKGIHSTCEVTANRAKFPVCDGALRNGRRRQTVVLSLVAEIQFRSDVTVELVRSSAHDSDVLFAARVSTMGEQTLESSLSGSELEAENEKRDRGLINYLMRDRHGSPFEHNSMTFYVQAPIFVFREFMRHRIASYNEESARYRELNPVFYVPAPDRNLVQVGKPGAYDFTPGTPEQIALTAESTKRAVTVAYEEYERMLAAGVAREVARGVLPVATYSSMYVTMNARSLMNFLSLRTKRDGTHFPSFPQREIEMVAEKMEDLWAALMPLTYEAFNQHGRVSP